MGCFWPAGHTFDTPALEARRRGAGEGHLSVNVWAVFKATLWLCLRLKALVSSFPRCWDSFLITWFTGPVSGPALDVSILNLSLEPACSTFTILQQSMCLNISVSSRNTWHEAALQHGGRSGRGGEEEQGSFCFVMSNAEFDFNTCGRFQRMGNHGDARPDFDGQGFEALWISGEHWNNREEIFLLGELIIYCSVFDELMFKQQTTKSRNSTSWWRKLSISHCCESWVEIIDFLCHKKKHVKCFEETFHCFLVESWTQLDYQCSLITECRQLDFSTTN